jgi:phenylacetate-coenzyme A ligase PaaK-like adenylate-forming protein
MNAIRLRQLILDAAAHVPFYRQHWKAAGVDLTRIGSAVHLEFLPVVKKADLLACPPELRIDQRYIERVARGESTSGSTGMPFEVPIDHASLRRRRWRFLNALRDVGYAPGEKLMLITDPPFPTGAAFLRWTYADLRRGEEAVFETYARTKPRVLYGPLSSLVLLARRMLATPQVKCRPKLVVSTAEQLTDAQRTLLETAFDARVADFYGMTELGLVAYSRPGLSGYQLLTDEFHFEMLRADGSAGLERLVVTDLNGGAMPLIRFDTGDLVRRDATRPGAPVVQVSGRVVDCLKLPTGSVLSPYEVTFALDRVDGIRQYQVVQRDDLSVDLYVAPAEPAEPSVLDRARQVLASICGGVMSINVHQRDEEPVRFDQKQRVVCSHAMA